MSIIQIESTQKAAHLLVNALYYSEDLSQAPVIIANKGVENESHLPTIAMAFITPNKEAETFVLTQKNLEMFRDNVEEKLFQVPQSRLSNQWKAQFLDVLDNIFSNQEEQANQAWNQLQFYFNLIPKIGLAMLYGDTTTGITFPGY